jgi:FdhD protein
VAVEEPLEIRLQGSTFLVTMRTPGADRELTAGLLLSERVVSHPTDIVAITAAGNIANVMLAGEAALRAAQTVARRRLVAATSACGVCGRQSVDDLLRDMPRVEASWAAAADVIASLPGRLRDAQAAFDETGGLHAAGLFDREGRAIAIAEDVGRHNAVDKVVGLQLLDGRLPLSGRILFVSGRTSFEIVQKAVAAGIPLVAAVSAPSSLAIELAREAGVTLAGFVRGETFNIYANPERITR